MTEPLENLYPEIGQIIAHSIPEAWKSASVTVEIKPGVTTLAGHFVPDDDSPERSFRIPRQLVDLFNLLHSRMSEEMQDNWKHAHFELKRDGKFDLKFSY